MVMKADTLVKQFEFLQNFEISINSEILIIIETL